MESRPSSGHRRSAAIKRRWVGGASFLAALAVAVVLVVVLATPDTAGRQGGSYWRTARVDARITFTGRPPRSLPMSYLGISSEYWTTPDWGRNLGVLSRVFGMLSTDGYLRLRIGGDSADRAIWSPKKEQPEWAFELTPSWLDLTRRIVLRTHAKLILDLNTMSSTPRLAARWARRAVAALPRGSVSAFEVGNEPDIYNQAAWQHLTAGHGAPPQPTHITAASYARSFGEFASAVSRAAPGIPLLGPALANPQKNSDWVTSLLAAPHPRLSGITVHRYPYSACARPSAPTFPSIPRVLSQNATAGMGQTALQLEHITDRARLPLWLTEINSVTCGGTKGVSNTFATALWAPDALFELAQSGVEAVCVHVRPPLVNMAFSVTRKGLTARPLLYGMILFARMLGPGAELVPLKLSRASDLNVKAWAVQLRGRVLHVLVLDKDSKPLRVGLRLMHGGQATIQRLLAPRISSTSGVTLDNQRLTGAGRWAGRRQTSQLAPRGNTYVLRLPRYSAAMLTFHTSHP